jgi:hypothetical protein
MGTAHKNVTKIVQVKKSRGSNCSLWILAILPLKQPKANPEKEDPNPASIVHTRKNSKIHSLLVARSQKQ